MLAGQEALVFGISPKPSLLSTWLVSRYSLNCCLLACRDWQAKYSKFTEALPTRAFLQALDEDEEVEVEISKGNIINIKYRAVGELQSNGTR